jgi:hypothetical protein
MAVDWVQATPWGPFSNNGVLQNNYYRIPFTGAPHIVATAYLDQVSLGTISGRGGTALATFKRYEFLDANGALQQVELTTNSSNLEVNSCVSITIAFDLEAAYATAGWSFFTLV